MKFINDSRCMYCIDCFSQNSISELTSSCNYCGTKKNYCNKDTDKTYKKNLKNSDSFKNYILHNEKKTSYDAMLMLSGGKDSLYSLIELKEKTGLNLLAFTISHPYKSLSSQKNIDIILDIYNVNYTLYRYNKKKFSKVINNFINDKKYHVPGFQKLICGFCTSVLLLNAYCFAFNMKIPNLLYCADINQLQSFPLEIEYFISFIKNLDIDQELLDGIVDLETIKRIDNTETMKPVICSPFSGIIEHDIEKIKSKLSSLELEGLEIDPERTNCRLQPIIKLNSFKNEKCYINAYKNMFNLNSDENVEEKINVYKEMYTKKEWTNSEISSLKLIHDKSIFSDSAINELENIRGLNDILEELNLAIR